MSPLDDNPGQPAYVFTERHDNGAVYETYRGLDVEAAKRFLLARHVDERLHYIVVETPAGNWGLDIEGLYLENLLPWQLRPDGADCVGRVRSVPNTFGMVSAARGTVDNFVAGVRCGRCDHDWYDGLRFQAVTAVRCPGCGAVNGVDSAGLGVRERPDGTTMITTTADVLIEQPREDETDLDGELLMLALDQIVADARAAVDATPTGDPRLPGRLFDLGSAVEERFRQSADAADLDIVVDLFARAVAATTAHDANLVVRVAGLARALNSRYDRTGRPADLDAIIAAVRRALAEHPDATGLWATLGLAYRDRFERVGRIGDLDDAVDAARTAVAEARSTAHLANLSATLRLRYEHTGRRDDLDQAVAAGETAVAVAGHDDPNRAVCRSVLGLALQDRYDLTGETADLTQAVDAFSDAVTTVPADDPTYPRHQHNLGRALAARFQRTDRLADLNAAVDAARAATAATSGGPNDGRVISQLGTVLVIRFERTGELADLDEGITVLRRAMAATPPEHADRARHSGEFGAALLTRYQRTGRPTDLDEAVAAVRDALAAEPATHPDRPEHLDLLGAALQGRFDRTGRPADLDDAVDAGRESVAGTPPGHPHLPRRRSNLGSALHSRYEDAGRPADLDEAVTHHRAAATTIPPDHPLRPALTFNLGSVLVERFQRSDEPTDLDEGIAALRRAADGIPPGQRLFPVYQQGLGYALRLRYLRTRTADDLVEALDATRRALDATPAGHPDRPSRLANLAVILRIRFGDGADPADLADAVGAARDAVATTPEGQPQRVERLSVLGTVLRTRYGHSGDPDDLDGALAAYAEGAGIPAGRPEHRINAAVLLGLTAIDADRVDTAADGFAAAVRLLPQFAWHGLPRSVREERVARWGGLSSDAAACAIRAGRPEQAVELLDAGRSVLWNQLLSVRTDATALAEREPELAARFDRIRTALDTPLPDTGATAPPIVGTGPAGARRVDPNTVAEQRMRLAREFDETVEQIRAVAGFEGFLRPTPFAELRAAASAGPVAIVNVSRHGCHALLVTDTGVRVVELPALSQRTALEQANTMLGALSQAGVPGRSFLDRERDRHAILDVLGWLWGAVTAPVLTALGYAAPAARRIWWNPTGPLAMLPLHAAGHHPRHHTDSPGTDTVPDRAISSYTPTLAGLLRARRTPRPAGPPALLAVGMTVTPGAAELPAVPEELDRIAGHHPIRTRLESPGDGPAPTVARVLAELPRHAWVHLSCHGTQHFGNPTASALLLADGRLRIADLIDNDAGPRELAFLSACQTATGSPRTVDEAIHLAAAMQVLGYRTVVGTLWSIYDATAADVADWFYAGLTGPGVPDPARALHDAVARLRRDRPTDPLAWAPYLHLGA